MNKKNQDEVEEIKSEDDNETESDVDKGAKKGKNLKEIKKYDLNKSDLNTTG